MTSVRSRIASLNALVCAALLFVLGGAVSAQDIIMEENFDGYNPGEFPSGFTLVWNGTGDANQVVTDAQSVSAPNSFTMEGQSGWTAVAEYPLSDWSRFITISCQVRIDAGGGSGGSSGALCLWNQTESTWGNYYLIMRFTDDNEVTLTSTNGEVAVLTTYSRETWYGVHIRYDTQSRTASVWIDDSQVADHYQLAGGSAGFDAFAFYNGSAHVPSYFDDLVISTDTIVYDIPTTSTGGIVALIALLIVIGGTALLWRSRAANAA